LKSALKTETKNNKVDFNVDHLDKLVESASKITIFEGNQNYTDAT